MMIDTEIRLSGEAAHDFHNMMTSVDMESINARDEFISGVSCQFDGGVLSIDISDLNIDFGAMDDSICEIEAVPVSKPEIISVGEISIHFVSSTTSNNNLLSERKTAYSADSYYVSSMNSVNQSVSIQFAA